MDSVPAYVAFNDRVLIQLARQRPSDENRLSDVPGVGAAKRAKYGAELLHLISEHRG
jgi:superfamily II DNA helicase RecQ